jgi:hypothetical protein
MIIYMAWDCQLNKAMFEGTLFGSKTKIIDQVVSFFAGEFPDDEKKIRKALEKGEEFQGVVITNFLSFDDVSDFQQYVRKYSTTPDYVIVNSILFTMDNYDHSGKEVLYTNLRLQKQMLVVTDDRYRKGFEDAVVSEDRLASYRTDINYMD